MDRIGRGKYAAAEVTMTKDNDPAAGDFEITKRTLVREALGAVGGGRLCSVREDEPLASVAELLGEAPGVHTVAVVDRDGRLVGIIPMRILLDDLFLRLVPEEFLVGMREMTGVEEFGRISRAGKSGELMEEPKFVRMDDTVRDAFTRMHEEQLEGLPIVDAEMKVVGYLDRFQLLRLWLRGQRKG